VRGNITRRGKRSWQLKFDVERIAGRRQIRYATVKGTRKDAEANLRGCERGQQRHARRFAITVGAWLLNGSPSRSCRDRQPMLS
jgi:hypothetical protein